MPSHIGQCHYEIWVSLKIIGWYNTKACYRVVLGHQTHDRYFDLVQKPVARYIAPESCTGIIPVNPWPDELIEVKCRVCILDFVFEEIVLMRLSDKTPLLEWLFKKIHDVAIVNSKSLVLELNASSENIECTTNRKRCSNAAFTCTVLVSGQMTDQVVRAERKATCVHFRIMAKLIL